MNPIHDTDATITEIAWQLRTDKQNFGDFLVKVLMGQRSACARYASYLHCAPAIRRVVFDEVASQIISKDYIQEIAPTYINTEAK